MKYYITVGVPGCGKSTLATKMMEDNPNLVEVNRDNLRKLVPNYKPGKFELDVEKQVNVQQQLLVNAAVADNKDIIFSDTNLSKSTIAHLHKLVKLAGGNHYISEIIDFTDYDSPNFVSIDTCIERDLKRVGSAQVGKDVILKYAAKIKHPKINKEGKQAFIFDIDGTLAHTNGRKPFEERYDSDVVDPTVLAVLKNLATTYDIIILSGRKGTEKGKQQTLDWLKKHGIPYNQFYMRVDRDNRKDYVIKREIYIRDIYPKYHVLGVFDDRPQVIYMWQALGLKVFNVGFGFEF